VRPVKTEPGQVYYSANPANDNRRVRILGPAFAGRVRVAVIDDQGAALRYRRVKVRQFHATILTRDGNSRRRGYILEK
jgi:hypothetical protein